MDNTNYTAENQTNSVPNQAPYQAPGQVPNTKFCKHCGGQIPADAVMCTMCGRQVEFMQGAPVQPQVVINNANTNFGGMPGTPKDKVTALLLLIFLGGFGAHKFYEGKVGMGILYIFTGALCGIGWIVDLITLIGKPSTYYV